MTIRQPIISVLGHVDHGKTTLLDKIRQSSISDREPGHITQHIGASEVPVSKIRSLCGRLVDEMMIKLEIPGLLFIDTPGHEAFTNLRKRGGSIADIAVLVVDINEGFQPQTVEAVEILKTFKTPFVVAATKIDLIPGWLKQKTFCFRESLKKQSQGVREMVDERIYKIVASLSSLGLVSERFDRVDDYQKTIAIIPVSGISGEGLSELLVMLSGLAQRYLKSRLKTDASGMTRGVVLEVNEEKGLGKTIDAIIYDGSIEEGDTIVIGGIPAPIVTKVKCLLKPKPLMEIQESSAKFERVKSVSAAAGVKIASHELENAIAGMPILKVHEGSVDEIKKMVNEDIQAVITVGKSGAVVKADSLGSLEAIKDLLTKAGLKIKRCGIGDVCKKDIIDVQDEDELSRVVFAFDVKVNAEAKELLNELKIPIFSSDIIYKLLDTYKEWKVNVVEAKKRDKLAQLLYVSKIQVLPEFVFRQSKPAIVGVEVLSGQLKPGVELMDSHGNVIGKLKSIQDSGKALPSADRGMKIAVSIDGAVFGKSFGGSDILYANVKEDDFKRLKEFKPMLKLGDIELLREVQEIKRKKNPVWGL